MRTAGRRITAVLAAVLTLFVIACGPDGAVGDSPHNDPFPAPIETPQNAQPPANPPANPNVQNPGPVQGDPSAHDPTPGEAEFHAVWKSETRFAPRIEYTTQAGQEPIPAGNLKVTKASDGYILVWVFYVPVKSGQTIGFTLFGTSSTFHVECMIIHHGQFHSMQTQTRNCASSYTIP